MFMLSACSILLFNVHHYGLSSAVPKSHSATSILIQADTAKHGTAFYALLEGFKLGALPCFASFRLYAPSFWFQVRPLAFMSS